MKRVKTIFGIIILIFTVFGCSSSFKIIERTDPSNPNFLIITSTPIQVKGIAISDYFESYLSFEFEKTNSAKNYNFIIKYVGSNWALLNKIILSIGSEKYTLLPERYPLRRQDGVVGVMELMYVKVPKNLIEQILDAQHAEIKVIGDNLKYRIILTGDIIKDLSKFYNKCLSVE